MITRKSAKVWQINFGDSQILTRAEAPGRLYVEGEPSPFCTSEEHDPMIHRVVDGRRFGVLTPAAGGFSFFVEDRCGRDFMTADAL